MGDLSTVRGQITDIQANDIDVLLLNIHESPGQDMLARFDFTSTPTYLIFDTAGDEVFRSNSLPTINEIIKKAQ